MAHLTGAVRVSEVTHSSTATHGDGADGRECAESHGQSRAAVVPAAQAHSPLRERVRTVQVQLDPGGTAGELVLIAATDPDSHRAVRLAGKSRARPDSTAAVSLPLLALLDVPPAFSIADVLRTLAPWRARIVHIRELASGAVVTAAVEPTRPDGGSGHRTPSTRLVGATGLDDSVLLDTSVGDDGYPVLLRCESEAVAAELIESLAGKPWLSLEPDRVAAVERVHAVVAAGGKPVPPQTLGNCPICLEDLGEAGVDVVTRLCSHSFHSDCLISCLDRCAAPRCPICRWAQPAPDASQCHDCVMQTGLWMCLVCGHLGCGRQQWHGSSQPLPAHGHALRHHEATGHAFAKSIDSEQVWNYSTDAYSQWLGQRDGIDSKLAEVPPGASPRKSSTYDVANPPLDPLLQIPEHERHEILALEYTYRLTTELEEARERFTSEQRALELAEQAEVELVAEQLRQAKERTVQLRTQLERAAKQIGSASKKAAENDTMIANAVERGKFEKGVADSIAANIPLLKVELNAVDAASEKRIDVVSSEVERLEQESDLLLSELSMAS